ncbi:MAG: IS66 family transposase [Vicinamibacterales bacterium]
MERKVADQAKLIADQAKHTADLQAQVVALLEKLNQNSQNSSRPPSSDQPNAPAKPAKRKSGRKPGGQPGHKGHERLLLPVDKKNVRDVKPDKCKNCGTRLAGEDDPDPYRHQVVEIPEPKPVVHEWRLHACTCGKCGATTRANLPEGVQPGGFGPRLIATIAVLSGAYRMTKRLTVSLLANLYGIPIALGSITACEKIASEAVAEPVKAAQEYVKQQGVKHADESSWFQGVQRTKVWLWIASTPLVTVFLIRASRGSDAARELLGQVLGVLVTDRWSGYNWWPTAWRQACWSHLKRDFQAFVDTHDPEAQSIGRSLLRHEKHLFKLWHRVRDGTLKRSSFRKYVEPIRRKVIKLLEWGEQCAHGKTAGTCSELLAVEETMWTFARMEGVEPTNNHGERGIRPGVILRKLTFGTHSVEGSRFVERMLSVVQTLKQQDRNALTFVTECVKAKMAGQKITQSLLPATA